MPFKLHTEIEDLNTQVMFESDCDKDNLKFVRNTVIGCNWSKAFLTIDTYNSLEANIHKDIVESGGALIMVIYARREEQSEK